MKCEIKYTEGYCSLGCDPDECEWNDGDADNINNPCRALSETLHGYSGEIIGYEIDDDDSPALSGGKGYVEINISKRKKIALIEDIRGRFCGAGYANIEYLKIDDNVLVPESEETANNEADNA